MHEALYGLGWPSCPMYRSVFGHKWITCDDARSRVGNPAGHLYRERGVMETEAMKDKGYMRGDASEYLVIENLADRPEDAQGGGDLLFCHRVNSWELAEAVNGESLVELIEQYAYDNGLMGDDGGLHDYFDLVDGFAEKIQESLRGAIIDGVSKSRWYHVEKVSEVKGE